MVKYYLLTLLLLQHMALLAQTDTAGKFSVSVNGELYYSYDFSNPANHEKADFIYNHKRHNEVNVNLITVRAHYVEKKTRANLGVMAGNYAQYNLRAEPNWAQLIYEANLGFRLSAKHNLWLDAGILPSHIGFESAISADCWTLTRSILAENSPYYETGLKLGYANKSEKLHLAFLVLNGWQRISRPVSAQYPSIGMQVAYQPSDRLLLNYSNFIGSDRADSQRSLRTYHNFYMQYQPQPTWGILAGFDLGTDKYNARDVGIWYSPVLIIRYQVCDQLTLAVRGEYYHDARQIIIPTNTPNGFQVSGVSANADYRINGCVTSRLEVKMYHAKEAVFPNGDLNNYMITANLGFRL